MHWLGWVLITIFGLAAAGALWERRAGRAFARRHPMPGRLVDVGGHSLHLLCAGETGPTIVVEQGAGEPSLLWRPIMGEAQQFARFCLYDRPGYLWSPSAERGRSVEARARDLHALLRNA